MLNVFIVYLIVMNLIGFTMMGLDKQWARKSKKRIPEKRLWLIALLGGAILMTIAMKMFHHKTKHANFKWGFPFIAIADLIISWFIFRI